MAWRLSNILWRNLAEGDGWPPCDAVEWTLVKSFLSAPIRSRRGYEPDLTDRVSQSAWGEIVRVQILIRHHHRVKWKRCQFPSTVTQLPNFPCRLPVPARPASSFTGKKRLPSNLCFREHPRRPRLPARPVRSYAGAGADSRGRGQEERCVE